MIHPQKFAVLVAANLGLVSNIFTTEVEARAWLDAWGRSVTVGRLIQSSCFTFNPNEGFITLQCSLPLQNDLHAPQSERDSGTVVMLTLLSVAWAYVTSLDRTLPVLLCALFLAGATTGAWGAEEERPRRVLMVHSFGSSAPPFTTHSTAFESTIKRELGTAVDLDEVSLDMARYAQPDMEEAFAEFLAKRMSEWQPDLVVPIGSPAGQVRGEIPGQAVPPDAGDLYGDGQADTAGRCVCEQRDVRRGELRFEGAGGGHAPARSGDEQRRGDPRGDAAGAVLDGGIPGGI